ncbi:complement C1q and tumor necrosis factor-related protein 9-like isoform X1 [Dreissena polymorpha]|uniref:C1q domain-containing protein n=1 Tax=Dreissena polymorpha TaxID=45954 RepID=A0A9D4QTR8_DREPO|nr:complement C1q and tumor necrosis factor-related protein 9-like isoform X1 [Dreissena polymorpha]KAH3842713.1 hypothetical protein DPMN_116217 [Dreissena polymorpha]
MAVWLVFLSLLYGFCFCTQTLEDQVASLDAIVRSLDAIVRQQNDNITALLVANNILKQEVAVLHEKNVKDRVRRQSEAFGFTAYLDGDEHIHKGQTLKFNRTLYNANHMYNLNTGVVTIPVEGKYIFSVAIEHYQQQILRCYLLVNGENMIDVIIHADSHSLNTQSSNTAVLGLNAGNAVWVTCDEGHVFGDNSFRGTTFSGALLN